MGNWVDIMVRKRNVYLKHKNALYSASQKVLLKNKLGIHSKKKKKKKKKKRFLYIKNFFLKKANFAHI